MEESRVVLARLPSVVFIALCLSVASVPSPALAARSSAGHTATTLRSRTSEGFHFKRVERCFMRKINRRRAARDLRRLRWDRQLGFVARRHARSMARAGGVRHDGWLRSKVTNWRTLGQNSGSGGRCRSLFRAFWRSPHHRGNILGRWRYLAVGGVRRGGTLYVQQVFEYRSNPGNIWGWP